MITDVSFANPSSDIILARSICSWRRVNKSWHAACGKFLKCFETDHANLWQKYTNPPLIYLRTQSFAHQDATYQEEYANTRAKTIQILLHRADRFCKYSSTLLIVAANLAINLDTLDTHSPIDMSTPLSNARDTAFTKNILCNYHATSLYVEALKKYGTLFHFNTHHQQRVSAKLATLAKNTATLMKFTSADDANLIKMKMWYITTAAELATIEEHTQWWIIERAAQIKNDMQEIVVAAYNSSKEPLYNFLHQ